MEDEVLKADNTYGTSYLGRYCSTVEFDFDWHYQTCHVTSKQRR